MRVRVSRSLPTTRELAAEGARRAQAATRVPVHDARLEYQDILTALATHAGLRASISNFARGVASPPLRLVRDPNYPATEAQRLMISDFLYVGGERQYRNILDYFGFTQKIFLTAGYFRALGQAAWWVLRNQYQVPVGWDVLMGLTVPNVDPKTGEFKSPAYRAYLPDRLLTPVPIESPDDLVFFMHPSLSGQLWGSDLEALLDLTLPADIEAQKAYMSMHRDRVAPLDGIWLVSPDVDDEEFERIDQELRERYAGSKAYGANPILARGQLEFKPIQSRTVDAPYSNGRRIARDEIAAITGVYGALLGDTEGMSSSNLAQLRRTFWEFTELPLTAMMEDIIWQQVCVRFFKAPGWRPKWEAPDFLTGVERAAIVARMRQWGIMDTNEGRAFMDMAPRPGGDGDFLLPMNMAVVDPRGGASDPTAPGQGDMQPGEEDPTQTVWPADVRPDETQRAAAEAELERWRGLALSAARKNRQWRSWMPDAMPVVLAEAINDELREHWPDPQMVERIFDVAQEMLGAIIG